MIRWTAHQQISCALLLGLLIGAIGCVSSQANAQPAPSEFSQIRSGFEQRGFAVHDDHPRCQREVDLFGLYTRGRRYVVVCQRGNRAETLLHEGWHLVQSMCLRSAPWLDDQRIEASLTDLDRRELAVLVQPNRWRRESEARVMAYASIPEYFKAMDRACQR